MSTKHSQRASRGAVEPKDVLNVVIVLPTSDELWSVTPYFKESLKRFGLVQTVEYIDGIIVYADPKDASYKVGVVSDAEMGNVGAAVTAAFVLGRYSPQLIISAGIAGSLDPSKAWIGDVLLPSTVEYLAINKVYGSLDDIKDNEKGRTIDFKADETHAARLEKRFKELKNQNTLNRFSMDKIRGVVKSAGTDFQRFDTEFKKIAKDISQLYPEAKKSIPRVPTAARGMCTFSWEKVQNSKEFHKFLVVNRHIEREPVCVEMESWGFARMSERLATLSPHEALVVRAISDIVGAKHVTDKVKYKDVNGNVADQGLCRMHAMASLGAALGEIVRQHRHPEPLP